jgi:hemolysin activation/secretion protein
VSTIFKSGETFDINWRRLQTQTQDLKATVIYPYILGLPFGADYNIKIYKKDSAFIDINNAFGLHYYFSGLNYLKVFYKQRNANLISTAGLENATVLPDYADVITKSYGLAVVLEKMDYKFNPHKGYSVTLQGSVGNRQIRKNPKINDAAYSSLALVTSQYQTDGIIMGYINIVKNHVLKLSSQFGSVFGNTIYKNELYRIGGLRTLRGFDEESIYASSYIIPTIEYRFLFEKNSNIFLFAEGAWYENKSSTTFITDTPMSIGAGINFETKAGIFNLSYGIGKQFNNSFDLRTGKIHAGLTALF